MKNTYSHSIFLALVLSCLLALPASGSEVTIVYPKTGQAIGAVDSTFIFGHVPFELASRFDDLIVRVNGEHIAQVHKDGGFLAFVPIQPGPFTFTVETYRKHVLSIEGDWPLPLATGSVEVLVPEPRENMEYGNARIGGDYRPPNGDVVLRTGDLLTISFTGTPNMSAWFAIPGVVDSVPMAETPPRPQAYWGESVFGAGAVPDSLMLKGIYTGYWRVTADMSMTEATVLYHLAAPPKAVSIMKSLMGLDADDPHADLQFFGRHARASGRSGYKISCNDPDYPFTVRFADSVQIVRYGPQRGYFSIFQPEGVEALAVGRIGSWYRLQCSPMQFAWANSESVERLPFGALPPRSLLRVVRTYAEDGGVRIEFPLAGQHPFQIVEDSPTRVKIRLFGVISDTDWIRYDGKDSLIDIATWQQPEPEMYELTVDLTEPLWGYDSYYDGNMFNVVLTKAPDRINFIEGKRIVIDPGHSSDPGAIGPTEYTEAEANLGIALKLAALLKRRGAEVVMTRDDDSHVALYDRPAIALEHEADLFISVHNNALPDGVNPYENNGTSAYYYHPHSKKLAAAIHDELLAATGLPDHGLYHGNLAVNRPTQYPAVLIECTFMILPNEEARLKTDRYRILLARAIGQGIEDFLREYERDN